jgi:hypothetical protein
MSQHHTVVNQKFDEAPARRVLKGNKREPEPGTHVIEFPGGAVEVSRLEDGSYWAHSILNRGRPGREWAGGFHGAIGEVVASRVDWVERRLEDIPCLPDGAHLTQIAVLLRPVTGGGS